MLIVLIVSLAIFLFLFYFAGETFRWNYFSFCVKFTNVFSFELCNKFVSTNFSSFITYIK